MYRKPAVAVHLFACLLISTLAFAQSPPENFDIRESKSKEALVAMERHLSRHPKQAETKDEVSRAIQQSAARLKTLVPGLEIKMSPRTGTPELVSVGLGKRSLTLPTTEGPERATRGFLQEYEDLYGLRGSQTLQLDTHVEYTNPAGNLSWVILEKTIRGRKVFRGELQAAVNQKGELVRIVGELPAGIKEGEVATNPTVSAAEAVSVAAKSIGLELDPFSLQVKEASPDGSTITFYPGPFADDIKVELQYFPLDVGAAELAWSMVLWRENDAYYTLVGAELADVFFRKNITDEQTTPATYRVYHSDSPAPLTPSNSTPAVPVQAPAVPRQTFTLISEGAFNDLGWLTDGVNTTTGNNVDAGLDRVSPNGIDPAGRPVGAPFRVFDFPYNPAPELAGEPGSNAPTDANYRWGAVTNLFFWTNRYHDRVYELGFTEAARNFQQNNFGRGGLGNDFVRAEAQDFSGTNNANFLTPPDGSLPRMQMYIWTGPAPDRDGDLDQDIVIHELTHGLSNRLHANASGLGSTMSRGMGEGWSDFYALSLLSEPTDDPNGIYPMGGYSTYLATAGYVSNYYYAIRRFPYAVRSNVGPNGKPHNPLTFADIDASKIDLTDGAFPRGPFGVGGTAGAHAVHNIGEVWASALWEVRARLINRLGHAAGNQRMLQYVTDGMKLDPINPTLLDGRDAILDAACASGFGSQDELDVWAGFAARGMGHDATTTSGLVVPFTVKEDFIPMPNAVLGNVTWVGGTCTADPHSGPYADPNETILLQVPMINPFCANPVPILTAFVGRSAAHYGTLAPSETVTRPIPYIVPAGSCGRILSVPVTIRSAIGTTTRSFNLQVGAATSRRPAGTAGTGDVAIPLPDDPAVTDIPIVVNAPGAVGDVNVRLRLNHTFDSDLVISLIAPDGTSVVLSGNRGGAGDNFGSGSNNCSGVFTVFDDSAPTAISAGVAPFAGSFRPDSPLAAFNGKNMAGTWILRIADTAPIDVGTLGCAQLQLEEQLYYCCGVPGNPIIQAAPPAVVQSENFTPANQAPDPNETVTMSFPLKNVGTGLTKNLVATLLPGGGVVGPTGAQSYGVLSPVGPAVARPFTFVVSGTCGGTINATLQLQDGTTNLGTVTFPILIGVIPTHTRANPASIVFPVDTPAAGDGVGPAAPYPAEIQVAGLNGTVGKVTVTLHNMEHTFPSDIDILLVGPQGQATWLMSDAGGGTDIVDVTLTFDDAAASGLPAAIVSGTFRPTNIGTENTLPAPAPPGAHPASLAVFNGTDPNGTWKLYAFDDGAVDDGSIAGFTVNITMAEAVCSASP